MPPTAIQPVLARRDDGHEVSDERARIDMGYVHAALETTSWAAGRPRALTERCWAHSRCFGVYAPAGAPVGFARLLTDYTFRAHLGDVFIDPAHRGRGLGAFLVGAILAHPELATVHNWTLNTRDAHGLYARFGFRLLALDGRQMILERPRADYSA